MGKFANVHMTGILAEKKGGGADVFACLTAGPFPGPVSLNCLTTQQARAQSLIRELKPHVFKSKTKQKQYCNKFSKDFKNGPHGKKIT